jgi:hypothetical protein
MLIKMSFLPLNFWLLLLKIKNRADDCYHRKLPQGAESGPAIVQKLPNINQVREPTEIQKVGPVLDQAREPNLDPAMVQKSPN